jgi:hypothetical protein
MLLLFERQSREGRTPGYITDRSLAVTIRINSIMTEN